MESEAEKNESEGVGEGVDDVSEEKDRSQAEGTGGERAELEEEAGEETAESSKNGGSRRGSRSAGVSSRADEAVMKHPSKAISSSSWL